MRNPALFVATLVLPLGLAACGPGATVDDFADRVCGCSTKECAEPIMKEFDAYMKSNPELQKAGEKDAKLTNAVTRLQKCRAKIENPNVTEAQLPQ
jgi:hypothetical protein